MDRQHPIRETFVLAKIAPFGVILAIISIVLYCFLVTLGFDFGILALLPFPFCVVAFLLGLLSTLIILVFRARFKGLVYSLSAVVFSLPIVYIGTEFFMSPNVRAENMKNYTTLYNMGLLGEALKKYAQSHNGILPDANSWCDSLMNQDLRLTAENFRHPQPDLLKLKGQCHIAFNNNLSGKSLDDLPGDVVLLFEADGEWNLNGTGSLLSKPYGEAKFLSILWVDGSTVDYWYDQKGIRKFDPSGKHMYHESPRWSP
jgi:hypothetical protein